MLKITPLPALKDNYIWIIHINASEVVVVDPGVSQVVCDWLKKEGLLPTAVLVTHRHWDHTDGVNALQDQFSIPVYGPNSPAVPCVTHPVNENSILDLIPRYNIKIIETPGHTLDHISFLIEQKLANSSSPKQLFCGDTLFSAGCGRIFDGTAELLFQSLQKLKNLPDDTLVYCTHEYTAANIQFALAVEPNNEALHCYSTKTREHEITLPTTIKVEMEVNPFLRTREPSVELAVNRHKNHRATSESETFVTLRAWKDQF
ncbi:hydroxyacylglutathione hydrolase [bacterium]|nr:hydroxyacylglutathione hydrolase [bacterium]